MPHSDGGYTAIAVLLRSAEYLMASMMGISAKNSFRSGGLTKNTDVIKRAASLPFFQSHVSRSYSHRKNCIKKVKLTYAFCTRQLDRNKVGDLKRQMVSDLPFTMSALQMKIMAQQSIASRAIDFHKVDLKAKFSAHDASALKP